MTKAVVATAYGGPEVLSVIEIEVPAPKAGEVTIDVKAAGINRYDAKRYSGMLGSDESKLPMRLGSEVAGVVSALGADAMGLAGPLSVGDEVIAYSISGGLAARVTVPAADVFPKPDNLSWEQAAGISLTGAAAYHLVEATEVTAGDTVLIHGASGGVGLAAAQLAIGRGAQVIGTASERRHEALRRYEVTPVVYGDGLADRVREAAPNGIDVALDTIGTDEAVDVSLELVGDRQRIATIAAFDRAPQEGIRLLGNGPGADPGEDIRSRARVVLTELAAHDRFDVVVATSFPLEEAAAALALVGGGHAGGKVVLTP